MPLQKRKIVESKILKELNDDQKKPVLDFYGPSFVVAGPGSGKTHCIVSRAAYMIESGINPENMLLFTFTKKASGELKERIERKIGPDAQGVTVGTYHSFCSRLLRKYAEYLGYENNFSIYDTEDSKGLLKKIIDDEFYKPEVVARRISEWKSKMITPEMALQSAEDPIMRKSSTYYKAYQDSLKENNAFDFDDLISAVIRLLQRNPSVKAEVNQKYQYVFADEFQDSSSKDMELVRLLSGDEQNVCMILDDEQGIYGFRGADIDTVLNAEVFFPGLKTFVLRQNYRSTKTIVNAARSLISHNLNQIPKEIFTDNEEGEKVVYMECPTPQDEATRVTKLIMGLTRTEDMKYKDIAVLYRMTHLSRPIEDALLKNGIPYVIVGGTPFYSRKEIKDIMSYIRLVYNTKDVQAFERIINVPKRGIGKKALENIMTVANQNKSVKMNLIEVCEAVELKGKAKEGLANFCKVIHTLQQSIENETPEQLIKKVIKLTDYTKHLMETEKEYDDKIANLIELQTIASQYESVDDFIYNMSLNSNIDNEGDDATDRVQLLTMHSSKGLEFKSVIVVGVNEGISPHWRADTRKQVDEERRLFYVALTRAEKLLFITRSRTVHMNGQPVAAKVSRFIDEIDNSYLLKTK